MDKVDNNMGGKSYKSFDDWSEAFDYCREGNVPVRVIIKEDIPLELWVLFPSGSASFVRALTEKETLSHMADSLGEYHD